MTEVPTLDLTDTHRVLRRLAKHPQFEIADDSRTLLDRSEIEALLPHREPFLFVDRIIQLEPESGRISASFDLAQASTHLAGHFPGNPVFPGVLQIEAVGQTGAILQASRQIDRDQLPALTHVLGARFVRPIGSEGVILINAEVITDSVFTTIAGQCIWRGVVCMAAIVRGV